MSAMSYKLSDWDKAHRAGRRVFFESSTLTIRQCPENHMLAYRQAYAPYRWIPAPDKASTINAHSLGFVLDQNQGLAGDAMADAVELGFWGELGHKTSSQELTGCTHEPAPEFTICASCYTRMVLDRVE